MLRPVIAPARADEADGGHVVRIQAEATGFSSPGTTLELWLPESPRATLPASLPEHQA